MSAEHTPTPIKLVKVNTTTLPWRLCIEQAGRDLYIPHASCRLKREALALKAKLEQVAGADWTDPDGWDDDTRAAVLAVLHQTESAEIQRRALAVDARNRQRWP